MSGWDVSSTPTWGPQDGPDETQAFTASGDGARDYGQDFGAPGAGAGYPGESMAGGPPPEFFGQEYGQEHDLGPGGYPQRTPGQSFQDLPSRESAHGRHGGAQPGGGYGQDNGYGQEGSYGQDNGYGQQGSYGQDNGYGQQGSYGQDNAYGQDWGGNGVGQADSWGPGGQDDGGWGRTAGRSAAPWDERRQDAGFGDADGGGFDRQDFGRQPEGPGFSAHDYAGQDFPGQQGRGGQAPMDFGRQNRGQSAQNDPALQDFFAPASGGGSGFPDQGQRPGWSGGEPPRDRRRPADEEVDWTGRPIRRTSPPPRRGDDDDSRGGISAKGLVAIGAVVVVVIAAAAYLFLHKGSSTPTASNTPAGGTVSSPAAAPSGSKAAGSSTGSGATTAAAAFTLSTPSTAGGYPKGTDLNDLKNATATAGQVITAVSGGGGGTAKGKPVSAAYTLPASQAITFVGYQGTFTPAKVAAILAKLGSDPHSYPAGSNGGILGCANTTTTPSGAVCVWATSSTLGITEFYNATGPEALTVSQSKGAADTVKLRADVEKKK